MLRQGNKVKQILTLGGGDLEAQAGKSLLVKKILCIPNTNDTYVTVSVDRVTVAYYRVKGRAGNNISPMLDNYHVSHIMDYLTAHKVNVFIPVAEGQTLNVSKYAETGNIMIIYDEYDAGDIRADMPNGSAAKEYTFLQYMSTSLTPTASQSLLLDTSLSPAEFPDFPCGKNVPAGTQITLLGLMGHPFTTGAVGPNAWGTTFVKLIREREVLFDEDRNGIPFDAYDDAAVADAYGCNFSLIGEPLAILEDASVMTPGEPLLFDPAIVFSAGEELNIYLTGIMTTAAAWEETMLSFAAILKIVKS